MRRWLVIGALVASASFAAAAPKGKAAKAAFDRGVVAYQKGNYAAASKALAQSYKLEADIETLFAWAQSERQQNKCESAIDLYNKLLALDMPAENKSVVQAKLDECKAIIAAKKGTVDKPVDPPKREPDPPARPEREERVVAPQPEPAPEPAREPDPPRAAVEPQPEGRTPWWKDPIGDALVIGGVIGLGVGGYMLYSGNQAEKRSFENVENFESEQNKAESHGRIGVIATIAGGALVVGGIIRYATRSSGGGEDRTNISGWITPDGAGGVAAFGRF